MKTLAGTVVLSSAFALSLSAFADGRLEGRITDSAGKVYFDGAIVKVKELGLQSSSTNGGQFSFNSIPAGSYTLVVDYLGAESVQQMVSIADNQTTSSTVKIGEQTSAMENVLVVGQAAGASAALNERRAADNMINVVSADSIGQFPDENVSEALQRVSGVFIERDQGEGRFVGVRGIEPNLNSSSINGLNIPAPERDRRSVALDVIPSGLLSGLEVTKSLTPDMDANAIGGSINVKSLNAFDREGMTYKVSAEAGYNELEGETSPKLAGSFTNVFEVGDGMLGVAAAMSWQDRDFGSEVMEGDGEWENDLEDSGIRGVKELQERDYTVNRERTGFALNLNWRPSLNSEYYLKSLYSDFSDHEYRQRTKYKFDKGDLVSITENSARWDDADMERTLKDRLEEQRIVSYIFGGENVVDDWTFEYSAGYSKSYEDEPNRHDTTFKNKGLELGYDSLGVTPVLYSSASGFVASDFKLDEVEVTNNYTEDEQTTFRFDITREMDFGDHSGIIKFGAKMSHREKSDDVRLDLYNDFGDLGDPTMDAFAQGNCDYDFSAFGPCLSTSGMASFINNNIIGVSALQDKEALAISQVESARDYLMEEDVLAFYIMSRIDMDDWRITYGVRYEDTEFTANGFNARLIDEETADITANRFENDYSKVLPSINVRYSTDEELVFRAAYSESFARPNFGDLTPSPAEIEIAEDDPGEYEVSVEAGNPNLEPYKSRNFDLSVEYYPGDIGIISAGIFYKDIENFIFNADVSDVEDPAQWAPGFNVVDFEVTKPLNGEGADLLGVELAYVKQFQNGFLLQANVTFTDGEADLGLGADADRSSKIDLPEQAETTGNLVFGYEQGPISLRLSGAYKSERLMGVDLGDASNDLYQDEHLQIDLTAKYDISDTMQVYFNAINLNDEPFYRYHGSSAYNAQYEKYGTSYVLGFTYRNF